MGNKKKSFLLDPSSPPTAAAESNHGPKCMCVSCWPPSPRPRCHGDVLLTRRKTIGENDVDVPMLSHCSHPPHSGCYSGHFFLAVTIPHHPLRTAVMKEPAEPNVNHRSRTARPSAFDTLRNPLYTSLCFWPRQHKESWPLEGAPILQNHVP